MEVFRIDYSAGPAALPVLGRRSAAAWGWRYLNRYKTVGGKRYRLHATRGWKCIGRVAP